jgi:hypothetical protein
MGAKIIKKSVGSALVVLLGLLVLLMVCSTLSMRFVTQISDVAIMRVQALQHMYAAEAMVLYGLAWCKINEQAINDLLKKQSTHLLHQGSWPWIKGVDLSGTITVSRKHPGVRIEVRLYKNQQLIAQQACDVMHDYDDGVTSMQWELL